MMPRDWIYLAIAITGALSTIGLAIDRWVHRQESEGTGLKREFLYLRSTYDQGNARLSKAMGEILKRIYDIEEHAKRLDKELVRIQTTIDHWPSRQTPRR